MQRVQYLFCSLIVLSVVEHCRDFSRLDHVVHGQFWAVQLVVVRIERSMLNDTLLHYLVFVEISKLQLEQANLLWRVDVHVFEVL